MTPDQRPSDQWPTPAQWQTNRGGADAFMRRMKHGAIQPMEQPGLIERLFRRR